jgi:hypothetical protein
MNLIEMSKSAIGKQAAGQIGGLLGLDEKKAGAAIDLALPALMGGIMKKAGTADGAGELFGMLDKFDGGMLDNLGGMLTGGKESMLIDMGKKILATLFGGNLSQILATVGKLVGVDATKAASLLGMLAPILLSVLGKQKKASGWDAAKFASALSAQKDFMPKLDPGLTNALGIGNLPGAGKDALGSAGRAVAGGVNRAQAAAGQASETGGSLLKLLLPLIALVAVGFLLWKFVLNPANGDTQKKDAPAGTGGAVAETETLPEKVEAIFADAKTALEGVKDVDTANTAVSSLGNLTEKIDGLGLASAAGPVKLLLKPIIASFRTAIDGVLARAYAIPGVEAILKPAVDRMLEKLSGV